MVSEEFFDMHLFFLAIIDKGFISRSSTGAKFKLIPCNFSASAVLFAKLEVFNGSLIFPISAQLSKSL